MSALLQNTQDSGRVQTEAPSPNPPAKGVLGEEYDDFDWLYEWAIPYALKGRWPNLKQTIPLSGGLWFYLPNSQLLHLGERIARVVNSLNDGDESLREGLDALLADIARIRHGWQTARYEKPIEPPEEGGWVVQDTTEDF